MKTAGGPDHAGREMTMRQWRLGVVAALGLVIAGCSGTPAPVPVVGAPVDIAKLAGEWGGDYHNDTNGRTGSIVFKLSAGADTAYGDVVMIPGQRRAEHMPSQDPAQGLPVSREPEVLSIAFVRATNGGLRGQLVPYRDPECDCLVVTHFKGAIRGNVLEGTFDTRHVEENQTLTGTWKAKRKTP
jgi:hypothetical protein